MMQADEENSAHKALVGRGEKRDRIEERRAEKGKETTNKSKNVFFIGLDLFETRMMDWRCLFWLHLLKNNAFCPWLVII